MNRDNQVFYGTQGLHGGWDQCPLAKDRLLKRCHGAVTRPTATGFLATEIVRGLLWRARRRWIVLGVWVTLWVMKMLLGIRVLGMLLLVWRLGLGTILLML